ncbi:MAG: glycosyltransferase family 2 protein [Bacteroidales bacterium]|nr:glycosyltransferase family 2 protein [Bacteroidales bacterium]
MEEIKVSVIIPIFGVEPYIERCTRSLLGQTMRSGIEFIFVDDCTPDRSIEILRKTLKEYPERYAQVTILTHSANKGLAAARKTGVSAARGEYIIHCDSDDWMEPDMCRLMYQEAKLTDSDIVVCNYINEYEGSSETVIQDFNPSKRNQLIDLLNWRMHCMVWLRIFRRSFYVTFAMDTPNINRGEDFPVSLLAHVLSSRVSYLRAPLYHYNRTNQESMTQRHTRKDYDDAVESWSYIRDFISSLPEDKEVRSALNRQLSRVRNKMLRYKEIYDMTRWRTLWPELKLEDCRNFRSKVLVAMARLRMDFILRLLLKDNASGINQF